MERVKYGLRLICPDITLTPTLTRSLICHPTTPCPAVSSISIAAEFASDGSLCLRYAITGEIAKIKLPAVRAPGPADNLWQHSCCEAFIASDAAMPYQEFNFSPSGEWAVYQFNAYRQREHNFVSPAAPQIALRLAGDGFELAARLPRELLPPLTTLHLGITSILEASDGSKSYWALAHGAGQPDFHSRQSFILALKRNTP